MISRSTSLERETGIEPATFSRRCSIGQRMLDYCSAGNASNRPGNIQPAGAPANSPTIVSVGALDSALKVAVFSNGGKVDIAGPGVECIFVLA
jgi:hypothetical protein